ncbi:MAG: hypothetical protein ABFD16_11095 [Thermoguttaceae bacterium]
MKRLMLALAFLALLGFTTSIASADILSEAQDDGARIQTAVLHPGNNAQLEPVWRGYGGYGGWGHNGWGWGGLGYGAWGYGAWGWDGWYGSRWPYSA